MLFSHYKFIDALLTLNLLETEIENIIGFDDKLKYAKWGNASVSYSELANVLLSYLFFLERTLNTARHRLNP